MEPIYHLFFINSVYFLKNCKKHEFECFIIRILCSEDLKHGNRMAYVSFYANQLLVGRYSSQIWSLISQSTQKIPEGNECRGKTK